MSRASVCRITGAVAALMLMVLAPVAAQAAGHAEPAWHLYVIPKPTQFSFAQDPDCEEHQHTGGAKDTDYNCDRYELLVTNVGAAPSTGRIKLTDTLPAGLKILQGPEAQNLEPHWECTAAPSEGREVVTCETEGSVPALAPATPVDIGVTVPDEQITVSNEAEVSGGGAAEPARVVTPTVINGPELPFTILESEAMFRNPAGEPETQAGGHPAGLSADFVISSNRRGNASNHQPEPVEDAKQIVTEFPAGLVGDARAAPACPVAEASGKVEENVDCPADTAIGTLSWSLPNGTETYLEIYNIVPEHGYPAEFGVFYPGLQRTIFLYASLVGSGANARVRVISGPQVDLKALTFSAITFTFFGDPNAYNDAPLSHQAFFTMPSDCDAPPMHTTFYVDSWEHPGRFEADGQPDLSEPNWKRSEAPMLPVTGCEKLQFAPTLSVSPTSHAPSTPTGLVTDVEVPQNEDPEGLATPPVKTTTVALPAGLAVSPSSANGLEACSDAEIALEAPGPGSCPAASSIGEVTLKTPLLGEPLTGKVYLGTPECDPCSNEAAADGRMLRLYIDATSERYGVSIKLVGHVTANPRTGQLTATFEETPQQPFSNLEVKFREGPRAPLVTPATCGEYETNATLTPWSAPATPSRTSTSSFTIEGCTGDPFAPAFATFDQNPQAGAYSPLDVELGRTDDEQHLHAFNAVLPVGVLAKLSGVPECGGGEIAAAQANAGECPASSEIGTVSVLAGPGTAPLEVRGRVYLTGPYNGGPFGAVVVVPAVAGPFNLGNVVVRASIRIDPTTTQVEIASDPFPTIIDGVPTDIRSVNVDVDRPGFTLNATNCAPMAVTGTATGVEGASAPLSSRFQVGGCTGLAFKPVLSAATAGRASKASGASLDVKVSYPVGPIGSYANIKSVKVDLPKQLPARLSTLQKACVAKVFEANPASCPSTSNVGTATATTPLLSVPLSGPAYLVSHGGEAFPDLEIVLQGEGVTLVLDGNTLIKKGITSSTFRAIPDAPVSGFELKLPTGKYSILSSNVPESAKFSLCGQSLSMPTAITAQNGAVIKQTTKIAVTGCPKARKATKKKAKAKKAGHGHNNGRKS
jgi:hypothetical protein